MASEAAIRAAQEIRSHEDPTWEEVADIIDEHTGLPDLLAAMKKIAAPRDCGCRPCRGQCESAEYLLVWIEEVRDLARAAIAKAEGRA